MLTPEQRLQGKFTQNQMLVMNMWFKKMKTVWKPKKVAAEDQVVKVNWSGRISKKRFHRKTTRGLQSIQEDITVNEIWEEGHKTIKMNGEEVLLLSSGKKMVGMETWWWNTTVHEAVKAKMKRTRRVTKPKQTKIGKIPRSKEISKESSFNGPWRSL